MEHYYEVYDFEHRDELGVESYGFETFEEAEEFANSKNLDYIVEVGGSWDEFKKCEWCGNFDLYYEIDENNGICDRCYAAIRSRGEKW